MIARQELSFLRAGVGKAAARANFLGYRFVFDLSQLGDRHRRVHGAGWLVKNSFPIQAMIRLVIAAVMQLHSCLQIWCLFLFGGVQETKVALLPPTL